MCGGEGLKSLPFAFSDIIGDEERKKMSFNTMKLSDLKNVAEYFAVDLDGAKTKTAILTALEEEGISYEMYDKFLNAEQAKPDILEKPKKKASSPNDVLVRMDRENAHYEVNGYTFKREHPFVVMNPEDAQFIFETQEGFRMATPREVQEYYN